MKQPLFHLPPFQVGLMTRMLAKPVNYGEQLHNIPDEWALTQGEGVMVGIVDTGLPTHGDIHGQIVHAANFTTSPIEDKVVGHSTHVSGIIAADNPVDGLVGIAPQAKLVIAKALDDDGSGSDEAIGKAIDFCVQQGCRIINMSLGAPAEAAPYMPQTHAACRNAYQKGVILVAASGNETANKVGAPALWDECIAVGAVDKDKKHASFSNTGAALDFAAFGVKVMSTYLNGTYVQLTGSSMASPHVAGIAALILAAHLGGKIKETPIKNGADMIEHLQRICLDCGEAGFDNTFGWGIPVFGHIDPRPTPPPPLLPPWWSWLRRWFWV